MLFCNQLYVCIGFQFKRFCLDGDWSEEMSCMYTHTHARAHTHARTHTREEDLDLVIHRNYRRFSELKAVLGISSQ